MMERFGRLGLIGSLVGALIAAFPAVAQSGSQVAKDGFESKTSKVNGIKLHYVRGGNGPAIVLIHGFPESWYEYHAIMSRLAKRFTVIAVDLRGIGGSASSDGGFDTANMAEDIRALAALT